MNRRSEKGENIKCGRNLKREYPNQGNVPNIKSGESQKVKFGENWWARLMEDSF